MLSSAQMKLAFICKHETNSNSDRFFDIVDSTGYP